MKASEIQLRYDKSVADAWADYSLIEKPLMVKCQRRVKKARKIYEEAMDAIKTDGK